MNKPMPIKLSGALVEEARRSAKLFNRSLTGQIEHWATLGRAIESQVSGETITRLLQQIGGTMKIGQVAGADQRQQVATVLAGFLAQSPGAEDNAWLHEMTAKGIPVYGTTLDEPEKIVRLASVPAPAAPASPSVTR